jgi:hypothetical protein
MLTTASIIASFATIISCPALNRVNGLAEAIKTKSQRLCKNRNIVGTTS